MKPNDFEQSHLEKLCNEILTFAQKKGATAAETSINVESGFTVSARMGEVETIEHHRDKGLGITVYFDHQTGSASTTDLSKDALQATVEKACNIARFTSSDPNSGLADADLMAHAYPQLALDFPWDITTDEALKLTTECENLARSYDPRIVNSEGASLSTHRNLQIYGNTHGFLGSYFTSQHSMNCILIAEQKNQMQRDYDYTVALDPSDLMNYETLAKKSASKTVQRLGARRMKTRSAPIIFSAPIARSLLGNFVSAISGHNIYRKSSFLAGQINKQIFPAHINIVQRPHLPKAVGSIPFDSEGVMTQDRDFIRDGQLLSYVLGIYSARKLGLKSTGNAGGIQNLIINHSDTDLPSLIKEMDTGLLVTELIGQGINLVTGDYSRGAFGYWIEKGEIQYPVEEITIAGNLKGMFLNIVKVANDIDTRGVIRTGSILIDNMMIAGE